MSMKEDLEKELEDFVLTHRTELFIDVALWAARWMGERIAQYHIDRYEYTGEETATEIRKLVKELDQ